MSRILGVVAAIALVAGAVFFITKTKTDNLTLGQEATTTPVQKEIQVIHLPTPQPMKGLYVTFYTFEAKKKFAEVIAQAQKYDLNSLIIDVRSDGQGLFDFNTNEVKQMLSDLHDKGLYLIARIVAFKKSDTEWYDPASQQRWQQIADTAKAAVDVGFDEINFDYVRYGGPNEQQSTTTIEQRRPNIQAFFEFLNKEVRQKLERPISADIFGVTFVNPEAGIGQRLEDAVQNFDYIMPMPYPSHWALGSLGIANPGDAPYQIVFQALYTGWVKVVHSPSRIASLRSWIQAFDIESITPWKLRPYTAQDVESQIKACYDAECSGWALWNGSSSYPDKYLSFPMPNPTSTIDVYPPPKITATSTATSTAASSTVTR